MARRVGLSGGMTALRAALGAVAGGLEGYSKAQELERKRKLDEEAVARQGRQDALSLALNKANLAEAGWEASDDYTAKRAAATSNLGSLLTSAFSGGTQAPAGPVDPRYLREAPMGRVTVDKQEYVLPETSRQYQERTTRSAQESEQKQRQSLADAKRNAELAESNSLRALAQRARQGGRDSEAAAELALVNPSAYNALFPRPERGSTNEPSDEDKSDIGLAFISSNARNPALISALQTAFANNPLAAQNPGLTAYRLMKGGAVPKQGASRGFEPPKPKAEKDDELAALLKEAAARDAVKKGGKPAPAGKPVASAGAPVAEPRAAAQSSTDQVAAAADKQSRRAQLWDQLKAKNPTLSDEQITQMVMRDIP